MLFVLPFAWHHCPNEAASPVFSVQKSLSPTSHAEVGSQLFEKRQVEKSCAQSFGSFQMSQFSALKKWQLSMLYSWSSSGMWWWLWSAWPDVDRRVFDNKKSPEDTCHCCEQLCLSDSYHAMSHMFYLKGKSLPRVASTHQYQWRFDNTTQVILGLGAGSAIVVTLISWDGGSSK